MKVRAAARSVPPKQQHPRLPRQRTAQDRTSQHAGTTGWSNHCLVLYYYLIINNEYKYMTER